MWHLLVDVYYKMNKTIPYEELIFFMFWVITLSIGKLIFAATAISNQQHTLCLYL